MTAPSDLPTLYKTKKVYVWVEDEETRTYLSIGRAQRALGQIPAEIKELRAALRAHGDLPP